MELKRIEKPIALQCLDQMEMLTAELERAMQAIGGNALPTFEDSVHRQQELCSDLGRLWQQMANERRARTRTNLGAGRSDDLLNERIESAAVSLHHLNARYALLLKHAGDTIRQFAALCRSYTGPVPSAAKSWSCEL